MSDREKIEKISLSNASVRKMLDYAKLGDITFTDAMTKLVIFFVEESDNLKELLAESMANSRCSPWVSVEDRLPEEHTNVIAFAKHSCFEPMQHIASYYHSAFIFDSWDKWDVTHWMPLPSAPKEPK